LQEWALKSPLGLARSGGSVFPRGPFRVPFPGLTLAMHAQPRHEMTFFVTCRPPSTLYQQ